MIPKNLKENLGYVCKSNNGYINELIEKIGDKCVHQFESIGFITRGCTIKSGTWSKTKLADRYYKDVFGIFSFYKTKIAK